MPLVRPAVFSIRDRNSLIENETALPILGGDRLKSPKLGERPRVPQGHNIVRRRKGMREWGFRGLKCST